MSAWVLPDHIADILPSEAKHIEMLRRKMLDKAWSYGYEMVMPPLIEHVDSLLTGTGKTLDLQTFKLVDQISGKMLGLRADTTQQVARIDAHLLNRKGTVRLCYCGPVLHTWPDRPRSTREPLQLGAEIYGHPGIEAELEAVELSLEFLKIGNFSKIIVDFADVRIVRRLLSVSGIADVREISEIYAALAAKDATELSSLTKNFPLEARSAILALLQIYGDEKVLSEAEKILKKFPELIKLISNLRWFVKRIKNAKVSFDLADIQGYMYYSGIRFALYAEEAESALVRGGRYDEVGAAFGRNRPAAGFSLDLKQIAAALPASFRRTAIRSLWGDSVDLLEAIAVLRAAGETVICAMPGSKSEDEDFCDRELVSINGKWVVQTL